MNGSTTLAMVASRAGVHFTTVARALRDHPSLPLATRRRLQALAAEMGYQPDPTLGALVAYRRRSQPPQDSRVLAYLTDGASRAEWGNQSSPKAYLEGARRMSLALGYQLEHFWLREEGTTLRSIDDALRSRGIIGVILASSSRAESFLGDFEWRDFCAVKINAAPSLPQLHGVTSAHHRMVALAMQHTFAAGYRRIGFVLPGEWDLQVGRAWSAGFLGEQQLIPEADRIPILTFAPPSPEQPAVPREHLSGWLSRHQPEVILSCESFVGAPLAELGRNGIAFVEMHLEKPDGTTAGIFHNGHRVGELAVELLAGKMEQHLNGAPDVPTASYVDGTWHDGASLPPRRYGMRAAPDHAHVDVNQGTLVEQAR
ncbi:MAG TPA: LacI family DNA-binding transcriptional regulator [Candidatus Didemnitutus sp.]|nr:LacI family DNA-binding transcriptional regulator [Candidatus Didemnitutus sp.]